MAQDVQDVIAFELDQIRKDIRETNGLLLQILIALNNQSASFSTQAVPAGTTQTN